MYPTLMLFSVVRANEASGSTHRRFKRASKFVIYGERYSWLCINGLCINFKALGINPDGWIVVLVARSLGVCAFSELFRRTLYLMFHTVPERAISNRFFLYLIYAMHVP